MDFTNLIQPAIIVALIIALTQAVKQIPVIEDNKRWCPTIAVFFGILAGIFAGVFFSGETELPKMIFHGLVYGLSASGLFDVGKQLKPKT